MDGDGAGFTFPSTEFTKGPEPTDISWGDEFLDGIPSDDPNSSDTNVIGSEGTTIGTAIHGNTHMVQSQSNVIGGQLFHLPTQFQNSLGNNTLQQVNSNAVAYLSQSGTSHVSTASRLQNVVPAVGQQVTSSVGQQQQNSAKLVQIAPTYPVASMQHLNNAAIQTLLQPNHSITGTTIYNSQGTGLFPSQGSVHIENPKVVNVNFGPHVIGSDGSGQQAIIQTAEGKRVLITNSQLSHMPQSISLSQPLVGTHLINPGGGNVIRASMATGTAPRQIVLPNAQTVLPRPANAQQAGITKNVVLNPGISPVIYHSGQSRQLIQSQPTLITSGGGLQVVNTGGNQGNQVQLIAQPSINQGGMGQQINQSTIMNFINNQSVIPNASGQITGLMPGQNILFNGQVLNLSQISGLTMSQLQVQPNTQGGVTLANLNTGVAQQAQFQPTTQHLVIQPGGQQHIMLQQKNTSSPSFMATGQRLGSNIQSGKMARTPTPNTNSASSTPVATPTPSTPTPAPTPEPIPDSGPGSKLSSILEQAILLSDIDLQSFEDDFSFIDNPPAFSSQPETPSLPVKSKPQPTKAKSKITKAKSKPTQPMTSVTVSNAVSTQQVNEHVQNTQVLRTTSGSEQQFISGNQVYVLSNGQQIILRPSGNAVAQQNKIVGPQSSFAGITVSSVSISPSSQPIQAFSQSNARTGVISQQKQDISMHVQQNNVLVSTTQDSSRIFNMNTQAVSTVHTSSPLAVNSQPVHSRPTSYSVSTPTNVSQSSPVITSQFQIKSQNITTLPFIKQEPITSVVKQEQFIAKQEPEVEVQMSIPSTHTFSHQSSFTYTLAHQSSPSFSPVTVTTSSIVTTAVPTVMSSHASTAQTTLINSSQNSMQQTSVTPSRAQIPRSSSVSCETSTAFTTTVYIHGLSSPTFSTSAMATSSKTSSSKEKDPNSVKVMTPIQIANSTLMLSLTPLQKKRLEDHISGMTLEEQKNFLTHQQNIIRRSQLVQQKQLEQQQKYQQQHKLQQQQQVQQLQQQLQQTQQQPPQQQTLLLSPQAQQQQSLQVTNLTRHSSSSSEYMGTVNEPGQTSLPSTVQELMDKQEDTQDQQQQIRHQTPVSQPSSLPSPAQPQIRVAPEVQLQQAPVQNYIFPPMGRCLAEQQLIRDRALALNPDVNSPFKSFSDAMRRLVRYHTLQDHKPDEGSKQIRKWDCRYNKMCDYLVKKKRFYLKRFNRLKMLNDMCPEKRPEYIQNLYCYNEQLQDLINYEKEEAKNHPETFQPNLLSTSSNSLSSDPLTLTPFEPNLLSTSTNSLSSDPLTFTELTNVKDEKLLEIKEEKKPKVKLEPSLEIKSEKSNSPHLSSSTLKKKLPEKSTGTLKFVFLRRTTDDFVVKNSLPQDLKPIVNLEKSDSEYEFDSHSSVSNSQSVIVRRRTSSISVASRQTSFEASSEYSSSNSRNKRQSQSSDEDESSQSDDDEEEASSSEEDEEEEDSGSSPAKKHCKSPYHVSFDNQLVNKSGPYKDDAFMDTCGTDKYKIVHSNSNTHSNSYMSDEPSSLKKSSSHSVMTSRAPYSISNSDLNNLSDTNYNVNRKLGSSNEIPYCARNTFQQSTVHISPPLPKSRSPSATTGKEAADRGLPIFTTPNKTLLQTDAMFNSSDEDCGNCKGISSFDIDNRDPQNSMINDSVRSAINSVLNDEDNQDSQTSWCSSVHRPASSSSMHHNLFPPSSPHSNHDADLDAAVQSIMNG